MSAPSRTDMAAWVVFIALVAAAAAAERFIGPIGLVVLGGAVWLRCLVLDLHKGEPSWVMEVFRALRNGTDMGAEYTEATAEEQREFAAYVRLFGWLGMGCGLAGCASLAFSLG